MTQLQQNQTFPRADTCLLDAKEGAGGCRANSATGVSHQLRGDHGVSTAPHVPPGHCAEPRTAGLGASAGPGRELTAFCGPSALQLRGTPWPGTAGPPAPAGFLQLAHSDVARECAWWAWRRRRGMCAGTREVCQQPRSAPVVCPPGPRPTLSILSTFALHFLLSPTTGQR